MSLLEHVDFISLLGLFVQAFVAWVFVSIFASLRSRDFHSRAFESYFLAFAALATALTVLSVRFFPTQRIHEVDPIWLDGSWLSTSSYVAYQALKALFGLLLVRGSYALVDRELPRWLRRAWWPIVALAAISPLVVEPMNLLMVLQAPLMIACSIAAVRTLRAAQDQGSGLRVVRLALMAQAAAWVLHAFTAATSTWSSTVYVVLSLASFIDLAVQLTLGCGLIISLLQDEHGRVLALEQERETLRREIERDEKLRALGTLVSGVAHELNNPLTVILGYADDLGDPAKCQRAARIVGEQAERCRGIVRSVSALAGQAVHPREEVNAAELVDRVVRGIEPHTREHGPRIQVGAIGSLSLQADRIGLEQVLTNLVVNAIHASPPGGEVAIGARATPDGVEFTVSDEGPGVPPELRTRLFEPFFTTKEPGKGTGLGLAIVHAIVRAHGGKIAVEDRPGGRGALFRVLLPHLPADAPKQAPACARQPSGRRLLIVDDDEAVRSVVRHHAERRGWSVSEVHSAEAALAHLQQAADYHAVLCDLRMPGIGGDGLHDRLAREHPRVLERTVFFTGDLASPESVRFSQRCRQPLVQKPFDFDELFATLGRSGAVAIARAE